MSLFADPAQPDTLFISYGWNDNEGWIAKMRLKSLLERLQPIGYI